MTDQYYCIRCGRSHREGSMAYKWHYDLGARSKREGFECHEVATGVAFVEATKEEWRTKPEASIGEIQGAFRELGFRDQYPDLNVKSQLREWRDHGYIGRDRHSGKEWFIFLANRRKTGPDNRSPESFHMWMKRFHSEFERANQR